ncbi:hypothetical protein Tco_0172645 [Tanacetum coccineum]
MQPPPSNSSIQGSLSRHSKVVSMFNSSNFKVFELEFGIDYAAYYMVEALIRSGGIELAAIRYTKLNYYSDSSFMIGKTTLSISKKDPVLFLQDD